MKRTSAKTVSEYNALQTENEKDICDFLMVNIDTNLKKSESKIWHGAPVWFLNGNPIVGYSKQKAGIKLMFWSGADFDEDALEIRGGKFKDASIIFTTIQQVNVKNLKLWIKKAKNIQWNYKDIVKRKGALIKI